MQPVEDYYHGAGASDRLPDRNSQQGFNASYNFANPSVPNNAPFSVIDFNASNPRVTDALPEGGFGLAPGAVANSTQLLPFNNSPHVTIHLPETLTGTFDEAQRKQVVIPGKRRSGAKDTARPPQGRRWVVNAAFACLVIVIVVSALMTVLPMDTVRVLGFNPISGMQMVKSSNNSGAISLQQAATATAVTVDGYDPGTGQTYAGLPTPTSYGSTIGSTLGLFSYGQCTYWADLRYHQLSGYWVPNFGNAANWYYGALNAPGWRVSSIPRVGAIMVLQPYTESATGYGHVAIVESILSPTSFNTSNYNWFTNGGGWNTYSEQVFYTGPGVSFIWHV